MVGDSVNFYVFYKVSGGDFITGDTTVPQHKGSPTVVRGSESDPAVLSQGFTMAKGDYKRPSGLHIVSPGNYFYHIPSLSIHLSNLCLKLSVVSDSYVFGQFAPLIDNPNREQVSAHLLPQPELIQFVSFLACADICMCCQCFIQDFPC